MGKTCAVCNSGNTQFKCSRCGKEYCFSHTGSTDEISCRIHGGLSPFLKLDREKAAAQDFKCTVVDNSRCPTCGSRLQLAQLPSGQFYLECVKHDWNSNQMSPIMLNSNDRNVLKDAERYGLVQRGKVCGEKLRRIKGTEFCQYCFLDVIRANTESSFHVLQAQFNMSQTDVEKVLEKFISEQKIQGILDTKAQIFIYFDPQKEAQIVADLQTNGYIDLGELQNRLSIKAEGAQRIVIELIRKNSLRGTFTQSRTRYYLESGLVQQILKEMNTQGRIDHLALAQKFDIAEGNLKNYIMNMLRQKMINAFFADNGKATVSQDQLEHEIEEYCLSNGVFFISALANQLKVAPELARRTLFGLIQKGTVRGVFTQNHEFITEETLSEKIKAIARAYRTIALTDLAQKLAITESRVEEGLAMLISRGAINGYIDVAKRQFVADAQQPASFASPYGVQAGKSGATSSAEAQSPTGPSSSDAAAAIPKMTGKVEVLRQYDFVGGQLHFKVVVRNMSNMAIHDIKVILDVPSSYRRSRELIGIPVIDPGNTHGVDFYLEPAECGISSIGGTVLYKDALGQYNTIYIEKKDVQIKCPLVIKTLDTIEDCQKAIQSLPSDARAFLIADLPPQMAYSAAYRAISQFDTRAVASYESKEAPYEAEAWFSSEAKVTGGRIITRIYYNGTNSTLEIRVWCNEAGQLTGFLAKIIELLFVEINLMRRIKAEERNKTLEAMAITRNLMEVADMCMLGFKASSAKLKLEDVHARLSKVVGDGHEIQQRIDNWIKILNEYGDEDNMTEDHANKLEKEIQLLQQQLHSVLSF
jgi:ribosomal protein S25